MKKILVLFIGSTLAFASQANTNSHNNGGFISPQEATQTNAVQGGFSGPSISETSVVKAKSFSDDTWVILTGKITRKIGDELYVFEDTTGSINVDIDHKRWRGQTVTPDNTVRIEGKVDKEWTSTEIDVKQITILK